LSFASLIKHNSVMTYGGVEALNHSWHQKLHAPTAFLSGK
jgi:hypothetical protein